ncbi:proline--tRNA ligase [Metallumcola ferriviriculae]|uniref:Proline--tRNA ligase n=1 Tax=Metallumcola ferriviriculae TaxID=3039180 RepID=A0AAU0USL1_9FIRM|nr:proline--tRNA ligase [Desulfitibacteraceae bacterium MK1]
MRVSKLLMPTLRENPSEAEVISHQLLVRAGLMRKAASGIYTYLPLGMRVLEKIKAIVKEEMDRFGGQEVMLPIIQPAELWQESGRWEVYGQEMFRLKDRHEREFCLGPTHEEIITSLVRNEVNSYKQLPILLYQIQNKYRDEKRPRFGLMRGREFIMKDLYSFDQDQTGLEESYEKMYKAYTNVFLRCGLQFRVVEADSGAIGGSTTHEFMVLAEAGEAQVVYCQKCDYAANVEKAEAVPDKIVVGTESEIQLVHTPNVRTIEEVAGHLGVAKKQLIKTLFYKADDQMVAVLVRGDREVNDIKVQNHLRCVQLELAQPEDVERMAGCSVGFVGPVGLEIKILADQEVAFIKSAVTGANKNDYHYTGVSLNRDFKVDDFTDLRMVQSGEPCPQCDSSLESARGIEVGQIFQLGEKYSQSLNAKYTDENGDEKFFVMGCYGIGVSRTIAAAIEQNYDQNGIIWPITLAPAHVVIIPVSTKEDEQVKEAEALYRQCLEAGIEAVLDDRNERAGVKFKDADLVGYPIRVTVGKKTIQDNSVDIKLRHSGAEEAVNKNLAVTKITEVVRDLIKSCQPKYLGNS